MHDVGFALADKQWRAVWRVDPPARGPRSTAGPARNCSKHPSTHVPTLVFRVKCHPPDDFKHFLSRPAARCGGGRRCPCCCCWTARTGPPPWPTPRRTAAPAPSTPPRWPRASTCSGTARWGRPCHACHAIGCHLTQETRVRNALDDVTSNIWQTLRRGVLYAGQVGAGVEQAAVRWGVGVGRPARLKVVGRTAQATSCCRV